MSITYDLAEVTYIAFYWTPEARYERLEFTMNPHDDFTVVAGEAEMLPADHSWELIHVARRHSGRRT